LDIGFMGGTLPRPQAEIGPREFGRDLGKDFCYRGWSLASEMVQSQFPTVSAGWIDMQGESQPMQ
jgi:hypothetical protein